MSRTRDRTDIIWTSEMLRSREHFVGRRHEHRFTLGGVVVLASDDQPGHIRYEVTADQLWRTHRVTTIVEFADLSQTFEVSIEGEGSWYCNGTMQSELEGCTDVDLGWTPATNTLPIRRLGLEVGEAKTLDVAWLRFPTLSLERASQTYHRLSSNLWRYSSGEFSADLVVDSGGYVLNYGPGFWTTIAYSS